jgi:predicted transposase YdaD
MADKPHDTFFQETFRKDADAAVELQSVFPAEIVKLFDWQSLRLRSANLVSSKTGRSQCDLLFTVKRQDIGEAAFVFVLFEHQSSNDRMMALRMLRYMLLIWERWLAKNPDAGPPLPPIIPVVFSHDEGGWRSPKRFRDLFSVDAGTVAILRRFVPAFEILVDDISTVTDEQLAARALPPGVALSLWALRDGRSPETLLAHVPFWASLFDALERIPGGRDVLLRILQYLGEAAGDDSVAIDTFAQEVIKHAPKASKVIMSSLEKFTAKARNEGIATGHSKGLREALLRILRRKFGELTAEQLARVERADEATVKELIDRAVTADSLSAALGS